MNFEAFDCLFLSRNPSGIKEQTFLESSVRVLFGAYQIDRSDVKNMMEKTMTKSGDKGIYNDFNEDDLVMDFTPAPHEQIAVNIITKPFAIIWFDFAIMYEFLLRSEVDF